MGEKIRLRHSQAVHDLKEMRFSKKKFIELCCQIFSGEPEKTLAEINIERTLNGEEQFLLEPKHLKQLGITAWVFGFVSSHHEDDELVDMFKYGIEHDWFYSEDTEEKYDIFDCILDDCLAVDRELYIFLSDYYITHFKNSKNIGARVHIAYSLSQTNLNFETIHGLYRKYPFTPDKEI